MIYRDGALFRNIKIIRKITFTKFVQQLLQENETLKGISPLDIFVHFFTIGREAFCHYNP